MQIRLGAEAAALYEVVKEQELQDIHSAGMLLRHRKTGARVVLLSNEDDNKVFYIGFRTPPADDTGVAHIIEHTVLCGSRDFDVRDPFIELAKGSLNTFLNAMTFPDKTVYPIASCNLQDFKNLMHVYLDAVFYPNIYKDRRIFEQEGWHYELKDGELIENGVVYNEMKGALSSPEDVLENATFASLYPHTVYANESGGNPASIPDLTYEAYLDFHRQYYHPSNSYIYLYGDMDMDERLLYLDRDYLSHFDCLQVDSAVRGEQAFEQPAETREFYSVMEEEDPADMAYLAMNYGFREKTDVMTGLGFKILDYVLCDAEGSPLKEALRENGIGEDVYSIFEDGILQPYYSIVAKYCAAEKKDAFREVIEKTLKKLEEDGLDQRSLEAGISYYEFRYREADFGSYPKGLVYGLQALDTWLYDEEDPWQKMNMGSLFGDLREKAGEGWFEQLIRTHLLENRHASLVVMEAERGLTEKKEALVKEKLAAYLKSLKEEEIEAIRNAEKSLRIWQEEPEAEEKIRSIPMLSRNDMEKKARVFANQTEEAEGVVLVKHPCFTNRIMYLTWLFDMKSLSEEELAWMTVFKALFGMMDTEKYSYADLNTELNILTGGLNPSVSAHVNRQDPDRYKVFFEISLKVMPENASAAVDLASEIMTHSCYDRYDRIRQVLEEERSGMREVLQSGGHYTAAARAQSYFSEPAMVMDITAGISAYRFLDDLLQHFEERKEQITAAMDKISRVLFSKGNMIADCTAEEADLERLPELSGRMRKTLYPAYASGERFVLHPIGKNEGFSTAGQVQYVCRAGNYRKAGFDYTGTLRILRVIMGYDFLWNRVRVKGGAYGCMSSFNRDGSALFVSYRDPKLKETIRVYEEAADYVENFQADECTMTKYIIGALGAMDHPMTPAQYGRYSLAGYLSGLTDKDLQDERDAVLKAQPEDIRALAGLIRAFMGDEYLCVIGSAESIGQNKELFENIEKLY